MQFLHQFFAIVLSFKSTRVWSIKASINTSNLFQLDHSYQKGNIKHERLLHENIEENQCNFGNQSLSRKTIVKYETRLKAGAEGSKIAWFTKTFPDIGTMFSSKDFITLSTGFE